jgi:hypothetical protein
MINVLSLVYPLVLSFTSQFQRDAPVGSTVGTATYSVPEFENVSNIVPSDRLYNLLFLLPIPTVMYVW